ncbi:F-box and leucine-rich repeat protein 7 [Geosmithia morbida]|uniref:F-box and leucine-rich repeat protein 7 n=1 Tax=Geosmithia morbida TaxID=1094350 RepID=A0A9P5D7X9_9HYPO|nr:F-box and leucine-rich repeat protein 7 [Geosmithia morbida]KAF4124969.1 F-box and leucine-rich repeat protein 7 [Geosmithia morbida]
MRRSRSPGSPSPFRALAHHHLTNSNPKDSIALIRSFNNETNPSRPIRPSPLTASVIRDMPQDLVDRIRSFPLFSSAPDDFLLEIGHHLKPQIHGMHDLIMTEGDDAKAMYWLVRGVVAVTSRDGEAVYAELKPGAFFGEIGVLMDMPRTATIVARTKCLLLVLKKEELHAVMPKYPDMEMAIRQEAHERLTLLNKRRAAAETGPADAQNSAKGDIAARTAAPGEVSKGETGHIRDGTTVVAKSSKKRKSPSPGIIDDPAAPGSSAIGSGLVSIRHTLKELPLFSSLPPDILHFLGLSAHPRAYAPFTDIVRQGSPGSDIYFIVRGEAEVIHEPPRTAGASSAETMPPVRQRPRLRQGQYFGEVTSLGYSRARTATVRSITTVECLVIPGDAMDELWKRCPGEIRSQVEETARMRLTREDRDVDMKDGSADEDGPDPTAKPTERAGPPAPLKPSPLVTLTTPSKPSSPSKDDGETMEHPDPDPFLSVNMENLRNRRRHSLAPPTLQTESLTNGIHHPHSQSSSSSPTTRSQQRSGWNRDEPEAPLDSDIPAKRVKTLPQRPAKTTTPSLSDDLLVNIFSYADIGELLRLRQVNSHWRRLVRSSDRVCRVVDLSMYNRTVTDQIVSQVVAPFAGHRAEIIDISNCFHISDEGFAALWRQCGRNVKRWRMRSVWDVSASQILEMSENAKGLEEVDWSNCRKVGDNLLGRVVGWVVPEPPPSNRQIVLPEPGKSKRQVQGETPSPQPRQQQQQARANPSMPAPGTVIGCPKLNTLNLSYCKHITDRSMAHLAAHASSRIESLSLTRCTSITDVGFQSWTSFRFDRLWNLCLADCTYLSDNAVVALVNGAKNLTHLDLSFCCALSDTATEVVALGLPRLRELRLAFCGSAVSDASLGSVALHLHDLQGISVRGCVRVTGKGVESLLRGCGGLSWLDASQCRNLEPWIRSGGVGRWGYDSRLGSPSPPPFSSLSPPSSTSSLSPPPASTRTSSPASPPEMRPLSQATGGIPLQAHGRYRRPVRFIIEKGGGLR